MVINPDLLEEVPVQISGCRNGDKAILWMLLNLSLPCLSEGCRLDQSP